jgi:hypothetical protein
MAKRFVLFIGFLACVFFLSGSDVFALSFNVVPYNVGSQPDSIVVGDFNQDGKLDLAVANSAGNNISILIGKGDGTFQPAENYTVGSGPSSATVGDFNKDGKLDLAVANSAGNNVSVLLNTTSATTVPGAPRKVKATASSEQATVSFLPPESDGGSPIISYTVTSSPGKITATGTSSPITVTGLTNGVAYTFTVTATNAIGAGPASAPSDKLIPGPRISVKPKSLNLGSVRVGSTSDPKTVTIKNIGNQYLVIDSISITGDDQSEFIETNDCSTIPAQSSCPITVTFAPAIPFGKKSASLSISSDDPNKPTIEVKLTGQASPPKISVSPKSAKLGSVTVGDTSPPKTITIKNTGISDLLIDDINITGTDAGEFNQTTSCGTIPKGGSCTIDVTFTPELAGKKSASMGISSNDPKHPVVTVNLSGAGI